MFTCHRGTDQKRQQLGCRAHEALADVCSGLCQVGLSARVYPQRDSKATGREGFYLHSLYQSSTDRGDCTGTSLACMRMRSTSGPSHLLSLHIETLARGTVCFSCACQTSHSRVPPVRLLGGGNWSGDGKAGQVSRMLPHQASHTQQPGPSVAHRASRPQLPLRSPDQMPPLEGRS